MVQSLRQTTDGFAGDVMPSEAWSALASNASAQLVDVRTHAEWVFAGMPDLSSIGKQPQAISWKLYPNFDRNAQFLEQLQSAVPDKSTPLYFLCKTGGRSTDAAIAAAEAGYQHCFNIAHGFEGDSNNSNQRGKVSGWKASNLPWNQA
jgi:rhodanese-related sulfurtransferase